jgi:hypothetical protein
MWQLAQATTGTKLLVTILNDFYIFWFVQTHHPILVCYFAALVKSFIYDMKTSNL